MDSVAVGILPWGQDRPVVDRIVHDEVSERRLVTRLGTRAGCGRVMRPDRPAMGCTGC
jgi:hypothetical protein